jgi:hypothetical protein
LPAPYAAEAPIAPERDVSNSAVIA